MHDFWKIALGVAGLGAVGSFVVWSLYKQWLQLDIFQRLTKKQQFILFLIFLVLTFLFGIAALVTYAIVNSNNSTSVGVSSEDVQKIASRFLSENAQLAESMASTREELGQLKERLANALRRVEEAEQKGDVEGVIAHLKANGDTEKLLRFLTDDRDKHKNDLLERNREIATIAYLRNDMTKAAAAIEEILRLQPDDLEALIVKANIVWLTRGGHHMVELFNRILDVATKKDDLEAQAGALANLGEFYWGGSGQLPPKSVEMFKRAKELERQLAQRRGVKYYESLPDHIPPLVKGNLLEYERFYHEWVDGRRPATPDVIAAAHGHIGVVRLKKGDLDGAEKRMLESLEKYEAITIPQFPQTLLGIASQQANLGIVFALRNDQNRAKEYWLKARSVYARFDARTAARINQWIQGIDATN